MHMRGKTFVACVAAGAGLVLVAGCGSGGNSGLGSAFTQSAAPKITTVAELSGAISDATSKQKSAKITVTMSQTTNGDTATESGSGVVQYNPVALDVTMDFGSIAGSGSAAGSGSGTTDLGQAQVIVVNGAFYMKLPSDTAQKLAQVFGNTDLASKPWIKVDPSGTDPLSEIFGPALKAAEEDNDPAGEIDQIKSAGTITATAQEQLDGQPVTHYTINVDLKKLADSLPDSDPEKQILDSRFDSGGATTETMDVWLNSQRLPLKTVEKSSDDSSTVSYSDWGAPVSIAAPPADQVISAAGN